MTRWFCAAGMWSTHNAAHTLFADLTVVTCAVHCLLQACASLQPDGNYRPRIVYVVVQKRHHVRLFNASAPGQLSNVEPGTVIDHTIVSPAVCDFYLNSHKDIQGAGEDETAILQQLRPSFAGNHFLHTVCSALALWLQCQT